MADIPVACTLGSQGMKTREEEWRSLLMPNLVRRSAIPGGARLVLRRSSGTKEELDRLIALESSCCAWIDWDVREESPSFLIVDATAGKAEGVTQLQAWFAPTAPTQSPAGASRA